VKDISAVTTHLTFKDGDGEILSQRQFCYALCFNKSFCRTFVETLFARSNHPTYWQCSPMFVQKMHYTDFVCIISNDNTKTHTVPFTENDKYTIELGNISDQEGRSDTMTIDNTIRLFGDVGRKLVQGSLIKFLPVLLSADPDGQYVVKLSWATKSRKLS
jgi:hypothetical protein